MLDIKYHWANFPIFDTDSSHYHVSRYSTNHTHGYEKINQIQTNIENEIELNPTNFLID